MSRLDEIKEDYLTGEMFGKEWCSTPKTNFEWLIEQAQKAQEYKNALLGIYNIDTMFLTADGGEREYDYKEAHDEMVRAAEEVLYNGKEK